MVKVKILQGAMHKLSSDLKKSLISNTKIIEKWNSLTPLARNEWICWTTSVKTEKTRKEHVKRVYTDLLKGKRRPCCWPGCPHREKNSKTKDTQQITQQTLHL